MRTLALIGFLAVVLFVAGVIVLTTIEIGSAGVRDSEPSIEDDEARKVEARRRRLAAAVKARAELRVVDAGDEDGLRAAMLDLERLR